MRQVPYGGGFPVSGALDGSRLLSFHQWHTQEGRVGYRPSWGGSLSLEVTSAGAGPLV